MSRGPTRTIGALAAYLEASQKAVGPADDTACLILYRSELAQVTAALRCWQAERARSRATCFAKALWCEEGGDLILPDAAAPTPPTAPEDQWVDWPGDTMTEAELLAGLEGLCGPLEPAGVPVQPRAPKHYGQGRQGPLRAPPSSASPSARPSCSPRFGFGDGSHGSTSTEEAEEPEGI